MGDRFTGFVVRAGEAALLAAVAQSGTETLHRGELIVRYGIRYLGKPHLAIVPGILALDYGQMLTGEAAWEFLLHNSNLYPRADVVGYRNDGTDEMIVVKKLDLALKPMILAYPDEQSVRPLAEIVALITEDTAGIPQRLLHYLPHYNTIEKWQQKDDG